MRQSTCSTSSRSRCRVMLFLLVLVGISARAAAAEFFVSPDGKPDGNGSPERPWDLATALAHPTAVQPGDTVWLRGGTYLGGCVSDLKGTADKPIVVRQAAGERAVFDLKPRDERDNALFVIRGEHAHYWGFEATCSDSKRVTEIKGSWPEDIRRGAVDIRGSHIKLINLVVHDAGGISAWSEGEGGEIYGCLIYHNGWKGPDRGHGHAVYAQNLNGTKRLIDNVVFAQFGYGIHCYGSQKASLQGFHIEGNAGFYNGALTNPDDRSADILVGGGTPVKRVAILNNFTNGGLRCGYPWGVINEDAEIRDNYIVGGLYVRDFPSLTVTGNTIIADNTLAWLEGSEGLDTSGFQWNRNTYLRTGKQWSTLVLRVGEKTRGVEFDDWRKEANIDADSTYAQAQPTGLVAFVRPNKYEPGRANLVVYNWDERESVPVDLSRVLKRGQPYRIVSVRDFFGDPVTAGTYSGEPVTLPMQPTPAVPPVGMPDGALPPTEPRFGAYVVLPGE